MVTSKIKIKLGAIEVEYEGSESFLKDELPSLLTAVSDLYQQPHMGAAQPAAGSAAAHPPARDGSPQINGHGRNAAIQGTTNHIATRLQVRSGPELVIAAAARLGIVEGASLFSRQRLIDEMKTASGLYKASYSKNLTRILRQLVKEQKLNEPSAENYALTPQCSSELEARLA